MTSTFTLRGRRGTWSHPPFTLRGRRGTWSHPPSLCVAGVALDDIDCYFAWQGWHLWHWAGSGGARGHQVARWRRGSPHLCVGFLFLVLYPAVRLLPATPVVPCPHHTQLVLTHNLLTHILSSHNLLTHTQLVITQLAHSHTSCSHTTYHLLTHNLSSHTSCHHTFTLRGRRGTW